MSIQIYDRYKVQPIYPVRGAGYEGRDRPGGERKLPRRPVAHAGGSSTIRALSRERDGSETTYKPTGLGRNWGCPDDPGERPGRQHPFAPTPYIPSIAGGADRVPGAGGGTAVDVWL